MISFVIPTLNELKNIDLTINSLKNSLTDTDFEIIFVDENSTDGTFQYCQKLALDDTGIRLLLRIGKRGLSSAVIEGVLVSRFDTIVIIDADLQYDLTNLKKACLSHLNGGFDLTIMTRDMVSLNNSTSLTNYRKKLTYYSRLIISFLIKSKVNDPNSGFFIINKSIIIKNYDKLTKIGFKLLLDILLSVKNLKINEVETFFHPRIHGKSKLNIIVFVDLIEMIFDKIFSGYISGKFIIFITCGCFGLLVQLALLQLLQNQMGQFEAPLVLSSILAASLNYILNNNITFRSKKITKFIKLKFLTYILICMVGLTFNLILVEKFIMLNTFSIVIGLIFAGVWNYFMSRNFVWRDV